MLERKENPKNQKFLDAHIHRDQNTGKSSNPWSLKKKKSKPTPYKLQQETEEEEIKKTVRSVSGGEARKKTNMYIWCFLLYNIR